jgi:hypothetical protein
MAKKKPKQEMPVKLPSSDSPPSPERIDDRSAAPAQADQGGTVLEEVQAFLAQRAELARKLTEEIEATEKKLAELRQTAALLMPQSASRIGKEKKAKKPSKPKAGMRQEEPASAPAEDEASETR